VIGVIRSCLSLLALVLLLLPTLLWAEVDVRVDRNPVQEDESFAIQFSSPNVDGEPDFSPLQNDFKILQTNQSRNLQLINGVMKQSVSWTLMLAPLHAGKIIIPSIAFGSDSSPKLELEVKPASNASSGVGNDLFFVQVEADSQSAYVQSQILVTVKLYLGSPNIMEPHLEDLSVSDKDASIQKLDKDADYNKRVGNRNYRVIEKKYAVFPQTPGTLTINSIKFETRYVEDRMALRYKQAKSKPLDIQVKPIPSQIGSGYWLPAADLQLTESWSPELDKLKEGEPATRTITLTATGVSSNLLPPVSQGDFSFAKQYPDQPALSDGTSDNGVVGKRVEKIAIIPSQAGSFIIPAIEIPWWNTKKDRMEYARIRAKRINVAASSETAKDQSPRQPQNAATSVSANENKKLSGVATSTAAPQAYSSNIWFYISVALAILWLATIAAWIKLHRLPGILNNGMAEPVSNRRKIEKAIDAAVIAGDLQKIKRLLIEWSVAVWGTQAPRSIGGMIHLCDAALADELEYLNNLLYSPDTPRHWDGRGLCVALKEYHHQSQRQANAGLQPLYQGIQ